MSATVYLQGSVAGVDLESSGGDKLKASLVGRGNLASARAVNNRTSAAGSLYTQSQVITEGIPFGIRIEYCPPDVFNALVAAIQAAIDAQSTFAVEVEDDISTVAVEAVVAGSGWLVMPDDQRTNPTTIKGPIVMNFLTAGAIEP